ncbi:carbohydrate ABC transporter permease [Paenibacillus humicola]|uniref:carbohydrate ABC transporter permease n=1 Tax=Paenibacillus humicola TaxID=3110540 RepID=UPI00237AF862|nr:sugar ABC transporter permease [Paenibacillus humicola]
MRWLRKSEARRETFYLYTFISPWVIGFILFIGGPILVSGYYSLTRYDIANAPVFIGLRNYIDLFQDDLFWKSSRVTLYYTLVGVPLGLFLSLLAALLLNADIRGQRLFRTIVYMPSVVSGVSLSLLWLWLLNPDFGAVNLIIYRLFGVQGPQWLTDEKWVIPSLIMMSLWTMGNHVVIYLAGLKGVPSNLYEAAQIDGASRLQQFWRITVPMISPATLFLLITGVIGSFQVFVQANVMTDGGPNYASYFYVYYLYQQAFHSFNLGYASSMAWILFLFVGVLTWVMMRLSNKWVHYEGGE